MAKILKTPWGGSGVPLGRMTEFIAELENPDRTAYKTGSSIGSDYTFQEWPNRASMARTIRMQESGPTRVNHWKPVLKLSDGEGY